MELTPEQKKVLDELDSADLDEGSEYQWEDSFQGEILALLLTDQYFLIQSRGLVKPSYFKNEVHKVACKELFKYFEKYKSLPPKRVVFQEISEEVQGKDEQIKAHYRGELSTVYEDLVTGTNTREYFLDKITTFAKIQSLRVTFQNCLEQIGKDPESQATWMKVYDMLRESMQTERRFEEGLEYFETYEERYERMKTLEETGELFTTSFPTIDKCLNGGLGRKEMGSFVGLPGTGKSLALVAASLANMDRGKRVLYISLEMDEDKIASRFDTQLAGNPAWSGSNADKISIEELYEHREIIFNALEKYAAVHDDRKLLFIKQFPAGQADVNTIRAYFSQLELWGAKPDLLIVDYIGEMKDYPGMKTYESRYRMVRDLRGMAVEEDICVLTAMQPNKDAREKMKLEEVIDDDNLADSFGQARPLDALWSINVTPLEKKANLGTMFIIKHRNGKSRVTFHFKFDPKTLRMKEIDSKEYARIRTKYENEETVERTETAVSNIQEKKDKERDKKFFSELELDKLN